MCLYVRASCPSPRCSTPQVLGERSQKDLREVREHIFQCFEDISCFLLPHPGFEVTKTKYDGDVNKIRGEFKSLLHHYVQKVFAPSALVPKKVHGRPVTAPELLQFVRSYVKIFRDATIFPEAKTLLAALFLSET